MNNCIVNEQGELLEILREGQEKELQDGQFLVPLSNYYDVLNLERFEKSIWSFELEKWIGQGEQRPVPEPQVNPMDMLGMATTQNSIELAELKQQIGAIGQGVVDIMLNQQMGGM